MSFKPFYNVYDNNYVMSYINSAREISELNQKKNKVKIPIDILKDYKIIKDSEFQTYMNDRYYFNYGEDYYFYNYKEYENNQEDFPEEEINNDYVSDDTTDSEDEFTEIL